MKYEINFDNNAVDKMFNELMYSFERTEFYYEAKDLERNIKNSVQFKCVLNTLEMLGATTDVGTYDDSGYTRIGYAMINGCVFVKNTEINFQGLYKALLGIAHKEENL